MDVRRSVNPVVSAGSTALARLNARHPWSHNDAFIPWILRNLPAERRTAVDVGCGRGGLLTELAREFGAVTGTDADAAMREAATRCTAGLPNVTISAANLADFDGPFDLITMTAVLHHLDTPDTLVQVKRLLAPGGRFLVVGLARRESLTDHLWDYASMVTNPIIGFIRHPRRVRAAAPTPPPFPVKDPDLTFAELRALFDEYLPGSRLRWRLGFRYTAEWTRPA
ncbi:MAG: class I SAM-dependent methyltransferase [Gordonia sp. (in: high G+C Gram-positive bacteria)]|uniref:class I SAM-dependent methyltransferase n=1 Tax=Gordonia sp. (in: high G+C Gram-positive bacteria) TaxID=84139 RepID=UPI0039E498AE